MNITVHQKKLRLGLLYGIVAGSAFAIFAWGTDAWLLARANSAYPWVKFLPGLIICILAGAVMGWLTVHFQRHGYAMLFWGLLAILFAWLVVWLAFDGSANIIKIINPSLAGIFTFKPIQDIGQFRIFSLVIIGLAALIAGLLEINLIDQALLSPYKVNSIAALIVCAALLGGAGTAIDQMINSNLREPVQVVNTLLQFAKDNVGVDVPKATARQMHLSATKQLDGLVQKPRQLLLIGFDDNLGTMNILVDFNGTRVRCTTIYAQPTDCTILP